MLGKGEHELRRIACENLQKQHSRTSWVQPSRTGFYNIPQIDWVCPPQFLVDPNWKMEAGSESQETHIQFQRESRTAEAIYYHYSDIPPNPYVAPNAFDFDYASKIPVIPLDVINDEMPPNDPLIPPRPTVKVGAKTIHPLLPRDEVIGTAVALVALIKSKEPGSQIDLELLVQLLCNPGMVEKLTKEHGLSPNVRSFVPFPVPSSADNVHNTSSSSTPFTRSLPRGVRNMIQQIHGNSESQIPSSNKKVDMGKIRKLISEYGVQLGDERVKPGPTVVKDADYYRRLISLHGMAQENGKPQGSVKQTGSQEQRPCVYFNCPKGCRHGSSCRFQHVKSSFGVGGHAVEEQQGDKRMKLSGGNFARHT